MSDNVDRPRVTIVIGPNHEWLEGWCRDNDVDPRSRDHAFITDVSDTRRLEGLRPDDARVVHAGPAADGDVYEWLDRRGLR